MAGGRQACFQENRESKEIRKCDDMHLIVQDLTALERIDLSLNNV